jgi:hypothetical protein
MTRAALDRAFQAAQLLAGVLCAALGLRVMTLAIADAHAARAPLPVLTAQAGTAPAPAPTPAPARTRHVPAPDRPRNSSNKDGAGEPLRLMLSVLAGPERSEVYVNGSRLGLTPYLGDLSCKQGEQLRIEVVPERDALISRSATCEGRTLLIR